MSSETNTPTQLQKTELHISPDIDSTYSGHPEAEIIPFPAGGREGNVEVFQDSDPTLPGGIERPKVPEERELPGKEFAERIDRIASGDPVITAEHLAFEATARNLAKQKEQIRPEDVDVNDLDNKSEEAFRKQYNV